MSACWGQILNRYTAAGSARKGSRPEHRCKAAGNQEEDVHLGLKHKQQNKTGNVHAKNLGNKESTEKEAWQTMDRNSDATKTYQMNMEIKFCFGLVCWCISRYSSYLYILRGFLLSASLHLSIFFFFFFLPHCFLVKKGCHFSPLLSLADLFWVCTC